MRWLWWTLGTVFAAMNGRADRGITMIPALRRLACAAGAAVGIDAQ